ncbi:MAG: lysophospholipid acyltransferase family protein [Myxococcota bacterium]
MTPKPRGSVWLYARTVAEMARVSVSTLQESLTGSLDRGVIDRRLDQWSANCADIARAQVIAAGLEHVGRGPYVVMSNHQSNFDIVAIYRAFPGSLRMVAKQEMSRLPLLGAAMNAAEFIFVDRKNNAAARASLDLARERIQSGINVWIAPEGTRSRDGELGPFKKGGFMLALQAGVPILPCTVTGSRDVVPVGSMEVHRHRRVHVRFHEAIDAPAYGLERRDALMADVRARIASGFVADH